MKEIILCKYGEIALKGLNKSTFESMMVKTIKRRLRSAGEFSITKSQSTLYVEPLGDDPDVDEFMERLSKIFGIVKICRSGIFEKDINAITAKAPEYLEELLETAHTFKVNAKRSDKKFPLKSPEICRELGGAILQKYPHLKVDVHHPDVTVTVEIREQAYVHGDPIDGAGGIPVGSSGRAMLLLSGGIDSPVAGYMMARRGAVVEAIHFEAPPYTSERAKMKVEKLAKIITAYCGDIKFFCVPFTEIQMQLRAHCPEELFTILMRRLMMEIAQRICEREGDIQALVTGESLGQVASQTMYAMVCTDAACRMPVFRPCVGMDKSEIVEISRKIGTFETSILPYEDCCTVFTPKHPKTKPSLVEVEKAQNSFDFEPFIQKAVDATTVELIKV